MWVRVGRLLANGDIATAGMEQHEAQSGKVTFAFDECECTDFS